MIPKTIDVQKLHDLFIEGLSISSIADQMETAESEIRYAITTLRKNDPDHWPIVKIESSFQPILPSIEKVNSEVVTRKMTPEEIDRLNSLGKQITDSMGAKIVKHHNYFNKSAKEEIEMKTALTKESYLIEKAAGKGNAQIERDWDMKPNSLYPLLKKWDVTGAKATTQEAGLIALNNSRKSEGIVIKPGIHGADALEASTLQHPIVDPKLTAILNYVRDLVGLDPRSVIFELISAERQRQDSLHPLFQSDLRMEILTEEIGEVARAKLEGDKIGLRKELIEVAAVAIRWVEALDRDQP